MAKQDPLARLNHLQRYLVEEYREDYQEGAMSRRQALKFIGAVMGSMAVASTVLAGCAPAPAAAPTASPAPGAPAATAATVPPTATVAPAAVASAAVPTAAATPTATQIAAVATQVTLTTTATTPTPTPAQIPVPSGVRVPADDPAVEGGMVSFPGDGFTIIAYQARPKGTGPFPAIVIAHENRGLTDHIQDVVRRAAKAGYLAVAPDLLSKQGGTAKITDPAEIPAALGNTSPDELAAHYLAAITYLKGLSLVATGRLGMVGFCFGGGMTWLTVTKSTDLKAGVPFYGPNPPLEDVPRITAAVLAIYGGDDQRIDAGIPAIEEAMQRNNKVFEKIVYPGAAHAFHNDTGRNYNPQASVDAWKRTLEWLGKYV